MGNVFATANVKSSPTLMLAGHIDELGLIIRYIDENGFLYFDTIGGHDKGLISGRRVDILTDGGIVKGVTGKRALHLMTPEERKKVPELHRMWIDIGGLEKNEAEKLVKVGDAAVYDHALDMVRGSIANSRAFDDKSGAYTVMEALLRVVGKKNLKAKVVSVATTQEEIGVRGATTAAHAVNQTSQLPSMSAMLLIIQIVINESMVITNWGWTNNLSRTTSNLTYTFDW